MYTKTITPAFEIKGKRKKLTGYIGELREGEQLIFSQEYSTNHDAEIALDARAFDLLHDNPQATAEPASTCCFCHEAHHPQDCSEMRAMLFAPHKSRCATCGDEGDCPDCAFSIGDTVYLRNDDGYHTVGIIDATPGFVDPISRRSVQYYSATFNCTDGQVENLWLSADDLIEKSRGAVPGIHSCATCGALLHCDCDDNAYAHAAADRAPLDVDFAPFAWET